jgi:hypothetical protein
MSDSVDSKEEFSGVILSWGAAVAHVRRRDNAGKSHL